VTHVFKLGDDPVWPPGGTHDAAFGCALEPEIAEALYGLDREAIAHPMFEDVPETLERIKALGVGTAIVSDIHFDFDRRSRCGDYYDSSTTSSFRSSRVAEARSWDLHTRPRPSGRTRLRGSHGRGSPLSGRRSGRCGNSHTAAAHGERTTTGAGQPSRPNRFAIRGPNSPRTQMVKCP